MGARVASPTSLYVGEPKRCQDCGEYVFFNHHMWSNGRTTHGPGNACERAHEAIRELPLTYDVLMGAVVQINELLGRFICQSDDDEYSDPKRLQRLLHDAYHLASEGIRAESIRKRTQCLIPAWARACGGRERSSASGAHVCSWRSTIASAAARTARQEAPDD